jgi:hypothetical protein
MIRSFCKIGFRSDIEKGILTPSHLTNYSDKIHQDFFDKTNMFSYLNTFTDYKKQTIYHPLKIFKKVRD